MSTDIVEPLDTDPRIFITGCRATFIKSSRSFQHQQDPRLHILRRSKESQDKLVGPYKKFRDAYGFNTSTDFVTRVTFPGGRLVVNFPGGINHLASDIAELLRANIEDTANLYSEASGVREPFHFKPSTVIDSDTHIHHVPVLSISWGGAGLAVDLNDRQTAQLEEGDYGLLSPRMPHRSPLRSPSGRMVMFIAPPDKG